jgi:riboflavin kinase/FMN adenylyltransferase
MEFIRGIHNIKPHHQGCIATIGNFDGVHLGHQTILQQITRQSQKTKSRSCVIIFEPQPKEFFLKDQAPKRICDLRQKLIFFADYQIDQVLCINFNNKFKQLSADNFITELLLEKLKVRTLYIGEDFKYGNDRIGNFNHLTSFATNNNFTAHVVPKFIKNNKKISSTLIRELLQNNDLSTANKFMGHPFTITGKVVTGNQYGRKLGFPTANIALKRTNIPINGVFIVRVIINGIVFFGVANIGLRLSIDNQHPILEVHILNFNKDLYGRLIQVEFIKKLRQTQKFSSMDELSKAIHQDVIQAKQFIDNLKHLLHR